MWYSFSTSQVGFFNNFILRWYCAIAQANKNQPLIPIKFSLFKISFSKYVATTSQRRRSHLGSGCGISVTCLVSQSYLDIDWYVVTTSEINQSYLRTNETSQRCLKQVRLIDVRVATS